MWKTVQKMLFHWFSDLFLSVSCVPGTGLEARDPSGGKTQSLPSHSWPHDGQDNPRNTAYLTTQGSHRGRRRTLCFISKSCKIVILLCIKIHFKVTIYFLIIQRLGPLPIFSQFLRESWDFGWITRSTPNGITGHKPSLKHLIHSHSSVPWRLLWLNVLSISYVLSSGETKTKPCILEKTNSNDFYPLRPESRPKLPQGIRGVKEGIHSLG